MEERIILDLDLAKLPLGSFPIEARSWSSPQPGLQRIGSWGGSALGVALLHAELSETPLVLAVGSAVARRLPTAARLSVLSRSPLSGRFGEGQIGGDLGPNLCTWADALILRGRTRVRGAVLILDAAGGARLESHPELLGHSPAEVWRLLQPEGALLSVGLGGERGLPYAVLAGGGEHPSFVGRGGLGAVFGGLGLKALVIEPKREPRGAPPRQSHPELHAILAASPRLAARASGGSMELYELDRDAGLGGRLAREAKARGVERKGCRGCPTPCGWVFERKDGQRQKGHFNANRALGAELGLSGFEDSLELLAICDHFGLDAREVGSMLALLVSDEERRGEHGLAGSLPALGAGIRCMLGLQDSVAGLPPEAFALGSAALAQRLGLPHARPHLQGQAAHALSGMAGLLGQAVSCGGADPMRSFPFLIDSLGLAGLNRVCRDLAPLPSGAEDPANPIAKGRLVAWHEDLVAAVDALGFCVFSTAGLLADGLADLERIAGWLLPADLLQGASGAWQALGLDQRLLGAGANLVELRRSLDRRYRALPRAAGQVDPDELSADQRERLSLPGMLEEYRRMRRDLDTLEGLGEPLERQRIADVEASRTVPREPPRRAPGRVTLVASGSLGRALGAGELQLELELPAQLAEVLQAACARDPALERQLFMAGSGARIPLPSVLRAGGRLGEGAWVESGDRLTLISVIAGG